MDLLQDTGAKALETRHLRPVEHVNVDMDTVLHDLRLGHFVAPDAEPPLWGIRMKLSIDHSRKRLGFV